MTYEDLYVDEKTAYCFIQKLNKYYKHKFDEILDAENENFSKINFSISLKIFRKESKNDSESTYEELAAYSFRDISIINHDLRSYQIKGKDWLISKDLGIMADDMGLGKTVQTIKAIETLLINSEINKTLVVAPVNLIKNWYREIQKWSPKLKVKILKPSKKDFELEWIKAYEKNHILLTNYEQLRNESSIFESMLFDILVIDEAHKIKNLSTAISKGVFRVKRNIFWALTGTPIENTPKDLASLLLQANPKKMFYLKDEKDTSMLKSIGSKFVLRRTKKDVLKELPPVTDLVVPLELEGNQKNEYQEIWLNRKKIAKTGGSYFSALAKLRETCDLHNDESVKVEKSIEIIKKVQELGEKVIVFSFYKPIASLLAERLEDEGIKFYQYKSEDNSEDRDFNLSSFKNDDKAAVFIASARIASEGLTITEANHVIFLNRWWTPSTNSQARDRVNRIGQSKNVFIYNLFVLNTIEERLNEILEDKNNLYEEITESFAEEILE